MTHLRKILSLGPTILATTIVSVLGLPETKGQVAGSGPGENYYPQPNSPINSDLALSLIEQKLTQMFRATKVSGVFVYTVPSLLLPVQSYDSGNTPPPNLPDGASISGYSLVNEVELDKALALVVADYLETPGIYPQGLEKLVQSAASYRKAKIGKFVAGATAAVLSYFDEIDDEPGRLAAIEQLAAGASKADPTQAKTVVASMLKVVAPTLKINSKTPVVSVPNAHLADDIVEKAVEQSAATSDAIVKAAIGAVKGVVDSSDPNIAKTLITGIASTAINTAFSSPVGADYLGTKIAIAIGTATKSATAKVNGQVQAIAKSADIVAAIFSPTNPNGLGQDLADIENVAVVAAGLMRGFHGSQFDGGDTSVNIRNAVHRTLGFTDELLTTNPAFAAQKTYIDTVHQGFAAARDVALPKDAATVASAVVAGSAGKHNDLAAYVTGATAWLEKAAPLFIAGILQRDDANDGDDTIAQIVAAAVRSSAGSAAKIANAAANWGKANDPTGETNRLGQILQGTATGLKGQPLYTTLLQASVASILKASPLQYTKVGGLNVLQPGSAAQLTELAKFGAQGVEGAEKFEAISVVIKTLQTAAAKDLEGYKAILQATIGPRSNDPQATYYVPESEQWRVILGAMAGNKKQAAEIQSWATNIANLPSYSEAENASAVTHGGNIIRALQETPKASFTRIYNEFATSGVAEDAKAANAILTGAGLAIPASTPMAAALAVKLTDASEESIRKTALAFLPSKAQNIHWTITAAVHVKSSTADLFDYVEQLVFQNPKFVNDIVTGATIVAPGYAHIIGHAVAFRAPAGVARTIPLLFNYSHLTSTDPKTPAPLFNQHSSDGPTHHSNPVDAAAAIAAGVTAGIVEAKVNTLKKPSQETTYLKSTVAALVKQAAALSGNTPENTPFLKDPYLANVSYQGEGLLGFKQSTGDVPVVDIDGKLVGGFTSTTQEGAAGVVTGMISQILDPAGVASNSGKLPVGSSVAAVITAAVKVVKTKTNLVLAIAQAAAQSIRWMAPTFSAAGEDEVINAVMAAFKLTDKNFPGMEPMVRNAVRFGVLAAIEKIPAAGAAGVINFAHRNASGLPVTDIFEL